MNRLAIYNEKTKPLLDYYDEKHLLVVIDGEQSTNKVFHDIISKLGEK